MFKPTPVLFDNKAREKILKGVHIIYEAVRRTLGPQGGNALIYGLYSRPYRVTNDGHTVANIIELKDSHEKLAASAIQDAAKRGKTLLTKNFDELAARARGAGALGVAVALNEIGEAEISDEFILKDLENVYTRRALYF